MNFTFIVCYYLYPYHHIFIIIIIITFQVTGNTTVDGIDYYVNDTFVEGLYNSCKDVKFGTMNTRAMEFVGGGANNFKGNFL